MEVADLALEVLDLLMDDGDARSVDARTVDGPYLSIEVLDLAMEVASMYTHLFSLSLSLSVYLSLSLSDGEGKPSGTLSMVCKGR